MSQRVAKAAPVLNKQAANMQITAEQLLREANERMIEHVDATPKQNITDPEELEAFRLDKRKKFEDNLRKNRDLVSNWIKYAKWEDSQDEVERARSVYERGLDVDHRSSTLWMSYAEMEMKRKHVNHARNIWDRAVLILPRVNKFWYRYTYMEELLGNVGGARQVFERWLQWHPEPQAWQTYINMELRYEEVERVRAIYERFIICHFEVKHWVKYAKFELAQGAVESARSVFDRCVEFYGSDNMEEALFLEYAKFEEQQKEFERARVIFKYALDNLPKEECKTLFATYTQFEKKYGNRAGIEEVIHSKRRFQYEEEVKANPNNYDAWFDYARLAEEEGDLDTIRDVYERAISNIPPAEDKRYWRRYIYLWIYYAVFEELVAKDAGKAQQVYQVCLQNIPHQKFTFAKVWLLAAQLEIRQKDLLAARKLLGKALGICPKDKLFKGYIELELQLREFDRCRTLYNKFLEFNPGNCQTWVKYAELEAILQDFKRTRAIYELAISQPVLDMPELLWKAYIDFEREMEEWGRTRDLYERLLEKTEHVKVWMSFAQFEGTVPENVDGADARAAKARGIYERGDESVKRSDDKAERLLLLEGWLKFETEQGNETNVEAVKAKLPRKIKKRRELFDEDGESTGWEEYYDYVYPDEQKAGPNLKLLEIARRWKQAQMQGGADEEEEEAEAADEAADGMATGEE